MLAFSPNQKFSVFAVGSEFRVFDQSTPDSIHQVSSHDLNSHPHIDTIRSLAFDEQSLWCLTSGDDKKVKLWSTQDWSCQCTTILPKKVTSARFSPNSGPSRDMILVSDRFGDVQAFKFSHVAVPTSTSTMEFTLDPIISFGHFSFATKLEFLTPPNQYPNISNCLVVSADADEKIRVSCWPDTYNIQSFCLGHIEFISSLVYLAPLDYTTSGSSGTSPILFASGAADSTIRIWNALTGDCLTEFDTCTLIPALPVIPNITEAVGAHPNPSLASSTASTENERVEKRRARKAENTLNFAAKIMARDVYQNSCMSSVISSMAFDTTSRTLVFIREGIANLGVLQISNVGLIFSPRLVSLQAAPMSIQFEGSTLWLAYASHVDNLLLTDPSSKVDDSKSVLNAINGVLADIKLSKPMDVWFKHMMGAKEHVRVEMEKAVKSRQNQSIQAKLKHKQSKHVLSLGHNSTLQNDDLEENIESDDGDEYDDED